MLRMGLDENTRELFEMIERSMASFPLLSESDKLLVVPHLDDLHIDYWTAETQSGRDQIKFDLQIREGVCDILGFFIKMSHRRKGYGTKLYSSVEEFAREYGCEYMQTTPSGQGIEFFKKRGFNIAWKFGVRKNLD
jgi:GNAT superfamily N-acetyltransferase